MQQKATMTIEEAASLLGINRNTAYEKALRGELPGARRLGRRWLVSRAVLERWLLGEQAGKAASA
jgi:excisionase family DNA binding protein